jgi:hypothetical protein
MLKMTVVIVMPCIYVPFYVQTLQVYALKIYNFKVILYLFSLPFVIEIIAIG